jgi:hypothetical protein
MSKSVLKYRNAIIMVDGWPTYYRDQGEYGSPGFNPTPGSTWEPRIFEEPRPEYDAESGNIIQGILDSIGIIKRLPNETEADTQRKYNPIAVLSIVGGIITLTIVTAIIMKSK